MHTHASTGPCAVSLQYSSPRLEILVWAVGVCYLLHTATIDTGTVNIIIALSVVFCMVGGSCHKVKFVALVSAFPHQSHLCRNNVSLTAPMSYFRTNAIFTAPMWDFPHMAILPHQTYDHRVSQMARHTDRSRRFNFYCSKSTNATNATFRFDSHCRFTHEWLYII